MTDYGPDETATDADPLTPEVAHALEDLDVPVPIPVEPAEEGEVLTVIRSDDELRDYVESRGYALVPLDKLATEVVLTDEGPRLRCSDSEVLSERARQSAAPAAGGNPKDAIGLTKPNLALVPAASNLYQAQAMMDGARKYGAYNWRSNPVLAMVYIAAAQRHISQFLDGEDFDPVSGCHHVGHALACLGILADANENGNLIDDRPVAGPAGEMIRRFGDTQSFK